MSIKGGIFGRVLMVAIIAILGLPIVASAQNRRLRDRNRDGVIDWRDADNSSWRRRDNNGDGRIDWRDQDVNGDGRVDWRDDINQDGRINRQDDRRYDNNDWRYRNDRVANDGYGNYGGSFDLRQTALNAGFADGVKEGRRDRSRGEHREWRDESDYQKATRDYSSRLGDRSLYMTYYRQAFENGYKDGYAGY